MQCLCSSRICMSPSLLIFARIISLTRRHDFLQPLCTDGNGYYIFVHISHPCISPARSAQRKKKKDKFSAATKACRRVRVRKHYNTVGERLSSNNVSTYITCAESYLWLRLYCRGYFPCFSTNILQVVHLALHPF